MALRAFHANPGIGGFGESTITTPASNYNDFEELSSSYKNKNKKKTKNRKKKHGDDNNDDDKYTRENSNGNGDLLCQIVKELVDNAVDACRSSCSRAYDHHDKEEERRTRNNQKRIKVEISPPPTKDADNDNSILQVTVSDNGCGMESIQDCVNAFHSSKRGDDEEGDNNNININNNTSKNSDNNNNNNHTSGRYGIGLTLCILHAQRCVPNSRVCITTVSAKSKHRTRAIFEVDKQGDSVDCVQEELTQASEDESGTCVSLLVPVSSSDCEIMVIIILRWYIFYWHVYNTRLLTMLHFFFLYLFFCFLSYICIYIYIYIYILGMNSRKTSLAKTK
jgi:hypothetical protein